MRMWMVNPKLLCRNHLLGEHNEIHKHKHIFIKKQSIKGRIYPIVLIEPENMQNRHDELTDEMIRRGYNHNSPFDSPDLSYLPDNLRFAKVDIGYNLTDLSNRCIECKKRITK